MINLIKNERIKISRFKKNIIIFILIITIFAITYYNRNSSSSEIFNTIYYLIPFLGVFSLLLYGNIISSEYQNGTFRFYVSKPHSRSKILFSKIIYTIVSIIIIVTIVILFYLIFMFFFNKFEINLLKEIPKVYMYSLPIYFICLLCMFISLLSKSTSISLTISFLLYLMSNIIFQICIGIGFNIIEYTFFPYLDFTIFLNRVYISNLNGDFSIHISENHGMVILFISSLLLIYIMNKIFNNCDIKT